MALLKWPHRCSYHAGYIFFCVQRTPCILQVLQDVSAEEFQQFVDVLLQLRTMATRKGAQDLVDIVANQADLSSDFQVSQLVCKNCVYNARASANYVRIIFFCPRGMAVCGRHDVFFPISST